ncbi:hypothetical protein LDENG_00095960 [Lucifuga dentata]|nr:hypothetical protein LDENG_00095960 [Lucifuga dentata]
MAGLSRLESRAPIFNLSSNTLISQQLSPHLLSVRNYLINSPPLLPLPPPISSITAHDIRSANMAFSSRFSFWEQKGSFDLVSFSYQHPQIKEENKPGSNSSETDGLCNRAQSVPALDPGRGLFRAKSPPVAPPESVAQVRSPSPPKVRTPVKLPEHLKSPETLSRVPERIKSPGPPPSPEPIINSGREQNGIVNKGVVNGTGSLNVNAKVTGTNQMDTTDDQGLTRKKVVKVVRRVVKKVLPTEEEAVTAVTTSNKAPEPAKLGPDPAKQASAPAPSSMFKTPKMPAFSFKHDVIKTEERDNISQGLTSLMGRGRTREARPRTIRKDERPEKVEPEDRNEKKEEKAEVETKEEQKEGKNTPKPEEVKLKSKSSVSLRKPEVKSSVVAEGSSSTPTSSKFAHSRPTSLPPVAGFIPVPKPSTLSPPPGFKPAPVPTSATKITSPTPTSNASVTPKSSTLSPPSGSTAAPKPSPLGTPVSSNAPCPKPGPTSPPAGITPIPKQPTVRKQEVLCQLLACVVNI